MKKYFLDKTNNNSNNMKLILSNYYSLEENNQKIKHNIPVNNVILPRYGVRDYTPFATTYDIDYNKPKAYRNIFLLRRK